MGASPTERLLTTRPPEQRITDFDRVQVLFSQWEGRIEQLTRGRFEGTMQLARSQNLLASYSTVNQVLAVSGDEGSGLCMFTLVVPQAADCIYLKRRFDPGYVIARGGSTRLDYQTSKFGVNLRFVASEETFRNAARTLQRFEPGPINWQAVRPSPDLFADFESGVHRLLAAFQNPRFRGSQDERQLEQECLMNAVAAFAGSEPHRADLAYSPRAHLVRRAEELIQSRVRTPTGAIDLCAELGVSSRTLRLAFWEHFGCGPMTYFQLVRLNAARKALKESDPDATTVAEVAQALGFGHLGKFAGYYRRLFGELPSSTLAGKSGR